MLWTLDWDLADVVTQSIVSWEETTGQSWSSQAVLEPKLQSWYAKSVDDFIFSGQSASFDHGKHIDAVAYSGALHFTINLFNTTQSQFPSILVASEIALQRLDNVLMGLTSETGGLAYIVDSAGNLVQRFLALTHSSLLSCTSGSHVNGTAIKCGDQLCGQADLSTRS